MKLNSLVILFLALVCFSCNSNKQIGSKTDSASTNGKIVKTLPAYFYKRLEGTIAGQKVVMNLNKVTQFVAGSYYYLDNGRSISLTVDTVISADSLILGEYILAEESGSAAAKLELKWTGIGFSGRFKNKFGKYFPINLKENYPLGSYRFSTDSVHDTKLANTAKPDGPKANFSVQYLTSTGKNEVWLNNNLKSINDITNGAAWKPAIKELAKAYFKDYEEQVKDAANSGSKDENLYFLNYASSSNNTVRYNENDFVVIEFLIYSYAGGAHGNYGSRFHNFDVANQKKMNLKDILSADTVTLNKIGETYFRKQFGLRASEPLTKVLFDDRFTLNDNFFINGKGISFLYNPYDIASYAQGQIDVFIPYHALLPYLNAAFKQRMKIE